MPGINLQYQSPTLTTSLPGYTYVELPTFTNIYPLPRINFNFRDINELLINKKGDEFVDR
jgi:hypothetical protein